MNCPTVETLKKIQRDIERVYYERRSEKVLSFIEHLPDLLYLIFGYSNSNGYIEAVQHEEDQSKNNITKRVSGIITRKSFQTPYNTMLEILSPGNKNNLFTLVFERFMQAEFRISCDDLPFHTSRIWKGQGKKDELIQSYIETLDYKPLNDYDRSISVSTSELFIISFLQSFKASQPSQSYFSSQDFDDSQETELHLQSNIYLILLRRYLEFLFHENKKGFCKIMFFMEDYLLNEYTRGSNLNSGSSYFQDSKSLGIPKPHLFDGIYIFVHYFQKYYGAFGVHAFKEKLRKEEIDCTKTRTRVSQTLFSFFEELFLIWNSDFSNSSPLICEAAKIWLKFLTPASVMDSWNIIDKLNFQNDDNTVKFSKRFEVMNLSRHEVISSMNNFVQTHINFFHDIFVNFLFCYSNLTKFSVKDILMINNIVSKLYIIQIISIMKEKMEFFKCIYHWISSTFLRIWITIEKV